LYLKDNMVLGGGEKIFYPDFLLKNLLLPVLAEYFMDLLDYLSK